MQLTLYLFVGLNFSRNVKITNDSPGTHILRIRPPMPIFGTALYLDYRGRIIVAEFVASVFSMIYKPLQTLL